MRPIPAYILLLCVLNAPAFAQSDESAVVRLRDAKTASLSASERIAFYEKLGYAVEERVSMGRRLY